MSPLTAPSPRLELTGIVKQFPGVLANDHVSLRIMPGEIHALLGENGAGKSTLVKMIYGVMRPDSGQMRLDGAAFAPDRPSDARAHGIGMVFQHFSLFEAMTVAENVALGMDGVRVGAALNREIIEISKAYGLELNPTRTVGALSAGERQRIEIVRCLLQRPRLLIMDEPTSVLTPQEAEALFRTLRQLASEGCSVLYISHKLEEIRALCDSATVMRGGKVVGAADPKAVSARGLAELMIGDTLAMPQASSTTFGPVALEVDGLTQRNADPFGIDLSDISFSVRRGEIFGIGGIAGNGQAELLGALIGETRTTANAIRLAGVGIGGRGPTARRKLGLLAAPEERLGHGAAPAMSLAENVVLTARARQGLARFGFLRLGNAKQFAEKVVSAFDVRTTGVGREAQSLSGGNLQRFVVGRELLQQPEVFIVSQPTWGVDAQAAAQIHKALQALAESGGAVVVISQDLDELMAISSTFAVMAGGKLSKPCPTADVTVAEIGRMMERAA